MGALPRIFFLSECLRWIRGQEKGILLKVFFGKRKAKMRFLFIRHGESENNVISPSEIMGKRAWTPETRMSFERQRSADPPLTLAGWEQIDAVAQHVAKGGVSALANLGNIYCSFQLRALQSADILHTHLPSSPVHCEVDLHEAGGCYKFNEINNRMEAERGLSPRDVMRRYPKARLPRGMALDGAWYRGTGKEREEEVQARAVRVLDWMRRLSEQEQEQEREVWHIVIAHGHFLNALVQHVEGHQRYFHFPNSSLTMFRASKKGIQVLYVGQKVMMGGTISSML